MSWYWIKKRGAPRRVLRVLYIKFGLGVVVAHKVLVTIPKSRGLGFDFFYIWGWAWTKDLDLGLSKTITITITP